jgi:hypothetical protein
MMMRVRVIATRGNLEINTDSKPCYFSYSQIFNCNHECKKYVEKFDLNLVSLNSKPDKQQNLIFEVLQG